MQFYIIIFKFLTVFPTARDTLLFMQESDSGWTDNLGIDPKPLLRESVA